MTDEEYVVHMTERERKRNGWGSFNKVRQGGSVVRLPSDNLTRKELKELSSDVTTFNLNAPITFTEFKKMPDDIKREYVTKIRDRFHVRTPEIAAMMGTSHRTLQLYLRDIGIADTRGGAHAKDLTEWNAWVKREWTKSETATPQAEIQQAIREEKHKVQEVLKETQPELTPIVYPESEPNQELNLNALTLLLKTLKGTGAKLTIEVTL